LSTTQKKAAKKKSPPPMSPPPGLGLPRLRLQGFGGDSVAGACGTRPSPSPPVAAVPPEEHKQQTHIGGIARHRPGSRSTCQRSQGTRSFSLHSENAESMIMNKGCASSPLARERFLSAFLSRLEKERRCRLCGRQKITGNQYPERP